MPSGVPGTEKASDAYSAVTRYVTWRARTSIVTQSLGQDSRERGIGCNPTCRCEFGCEIGPGRDVLGPVLNIQYAITRCLRCVQHVGLAQLGVRAPCKASGRQFEPSSSTTFDSRGVAQPGRALHLGCSGQRFESSCPDQFSLSPIAGRKRRTTTFRNYGCLAQLAERWSPKPKVEGSIPSTPASTTDRAPLVCGSLPR